MHTKATIIDGYADWREPTGLAAINYTSSVAVTAWFNAQRNAKADEERIKRLRFFEQSKDCARLCFSETPPPPFVTSRIEHTPLSIEHLYNIRPPQRRIKCQHPTLWAWFSQEIVEVVSMRDYGEKSFSDLPPHYRRLLRFAPLPLKREANAMEQQSAYDLNDTNSDCRTFENVLELITQ